MVRLELLTGLVNVTDPTEVARYHAAYEQLADLALRGADAVPLIHRARDEFSRR
ncbi:MAG: Scr1 family TA system antitoxin-like transcriptional regulator [Pseudonocardiaceae bacterium]